MGYTFELNPRGFRDQNAGPVASWLVAARGLKKKMDIIKILPSGQPLRPIWALIKMQVQLCTTWDSKAHKKCEWRAREFQNLNPTGQPLLQTNVPGISEGPHCMEVEPSRQSTRKWQAFVIGNLHICVCGKSLLRNLRVWYPASKWDQNGVWIEMGKLLFI